MIIPAGFQYVSSRCKVVARPGALDALAAEADAIGVRRLMLVSGTRSARGAAAQATRAALGSLIVCEAVGVPPHSGIDTVESMVARARQESVDGFVAVGGGSASDSAKAAAILLGEGGTLADHAKPRLSILNLKAAQWTGSQLKLGILSW